MPRLTLRQRLIAIAIGAVVAAVEAHTPGPKLAKAAAGSAPAASCAVQSATRC
jgi:hypothetical protein